MIYCHDDVYQYRLSKRGLIHTHTVYDNLRRDRDEILQERKVKRERDLFKPKERKSGEKRKEYKTQGEFEILSKVKKYPNYYIILINANNVRIIMIIVVILTIGNSPILY